MIGLNENIPDNTFSTVPNLLIGSYPPPRNNNCSLLLVFFDECGHAQDLRA